jgi:DNA modification methylase
MLTSGRQTAVWQQEEDQGKSGMQSASSSHQDSLALESRRSSLRSNERSARKSPPRLFDLHSISGLVTSTRESGVDAIGSRGSEVEPVYRLGRVSLYQADCIAWLRTRPHVSVHGVVTDPPYSLVEYEPQQQEKMRNGQGGVWRIPPSFDGSQRSPVPRFTTLSAKQLDNLSEFFNEWADALLPVLVPGAHVLVATNPLVSYIVTEAVVRAGFERRGEVVRLVMTMRGGDRPKGAHEEFSDVSVMPRSMWEPWLLFRKPLMGRVQDNLRKWKTGGLRRISGDRPFGDVIKSAPTRRSERAIANHPSLKPQAFLRQVVRAILPLGEGVVLDPFAGSGSTLAAAMAVGYEAIGVELDSIYIGVAEQAIPSLAALPVENDR